MRRAMHFLTHRWRLFLKRRSSPGCRSANGVMGWTRRRSSRNRCGVWVSRGFTTRGPASMRLANWAYPSRGSCRSALSHVRNWRLAWDAGRWSSPAARHRPKDFPARPAVAIWTRAWCCGSRKILSEDQRKPATCSRACSGLQGLTGHPLSLADLLTGSDAQWQLAREVFLHAVLHACGAGIAAMGDVDAIVYSGRYATGGTTLHAWLNQRLEPALRRTIPCLIHTRSRAQHLRDIVRVMAREDSRGTRSHGGDGALGMPRDTPRP